MLNGVSLLGEKNLKCTKKDTKPTKKNFFLVFAFSANAWAFSSGRVCAWKSVTCVTVRFAEDALPEHSGCPFIFSPLAVVVD